MSAAAAIPGASTRRTGALLAAAIRGDARLPQAATLSLLLTANVTWFDLGASWVQAAVTIASALGTQYAACRMLALRWDWRSALITGLSLSLLLRSHDPAAWACAGLLGIGSKFVLRADGKQVFNPACFAIVAMLLLSGQVWVSPGQWGALAWTALLLAGAGFLVLQRAARADTALAFFASYAGLLAWRCWRLGDPWTIPWHQVQSGSLLIFTFFMVTDPRSTPDARAGRIAFAVLVACIAHALQFGWQVREGLFYALFLVSPLTMVIDRLLPARRFTWSAPVPETAR